MSKDYVAMGRDFGRGVRAISKQAPELMGAYLDLASASSKEGALDTKTKELMAVAIGIVTRCDGCIAFHIQAALKAGAAREEVIDTIGVAIEMGGGPAVVFGVGALEAYEQFVQTEFSSEKVG